MTAETVLGQQAAEQDHERAPGYGPAGPPGEARDRASGPDQDPAPGQAAPASMRQLPERHRELREQVVTGRQAATDRQRALGKLTARQRLDLLLDPGSFTETGLHRRRLRSAGLMEGSRPHTDGVITGCGMIGGRQVFVYAQDFTILGGSLGEAHASKIHRLMDLALAAGIPVIGLNDKGGARIQEGVMALDGYGGIFYRNVQASGVIPQISVILGPYAGGAAYSPVILRALWRRNSSAICPWS